MFRPSISAKPSLRKASFQRQVRFASSEVKLNSEHSRCLGKNVLGVIEKSDTKLVDKLNTIPTDYSFKLNSASAEELNALNVDNVYSIIGRLDDPWVKEWSKNGNDPTKWLNSLKQQYGSVDNCLYCFRLMKCFGVYPSLEHYKVAIDILARCAYVYGVSEILGELATRHEHAKPDGEVYGIVLRMAVETKDYPRAKYMVKFMRENNYEIDNEVLEGAKELQKKWDHDAYVQYTLYDAAKPDFVKDMETEIQNRLTATMSSKQYSTETLQQRYERLAPMGIIPDECLKFLKQ
eukprot:gb/GECH01011359.1/.p1 GENE.gb/GECH01011359.1/~~gb/GECH01011359.1/.p1  ORF type:complete len:292 (+),score=56.72 gb/GECH01011359.1/:1-876(+)